MVRLLTLPEAAEILGCSVTTVRRLLRDGSLNPVKVRRSVRVEAGELAQYVETQKGTDAQRTTKHPGD